MHLMKFLQFRPHGYNGINIQNEIKLAKKNPVVALHQWLKLLYLQVLGLRESSKPSISLSSLA